MALLRKIRSATLIEALVATVLIVIVFMIASLILNNLLFNSFSKNTHPVDTRVSELEYLVQNKAIQLPYSEEFGNWDIELTKEKINGNLFIKSQTVNRGNKKEVIKTKLHAPD